MYVYFIQSGPKPTGFIKIGYAKNPERRLRDLQTANPNILRLIHTVKCDSKGHAQSMEKYFHSVFARYRKNGEWFHCARQLKKLGIIKRINKNKDGKYVTV